MKRAILFFALATFLALNCHALDAPTGLIARSGDQSIVLHWERSRENSVAGYRVYRSEAPTGPFTPANRELVRSPGYCDFEVADGQTNYYQVTVVTLAQQESPPSSAVTAVPAAFANDDAFLEYLQSTSFDYFWYAANPENGLIPDRTSAHSACSIAAVGFGLSAITVGIDHGWISRPAGAARVRTTLNTFLRGPQGPEAQERIGYHGWFYHFIDMSRGLRMNSELSSIDTGLLLAGVLHAGLYFSGPTDDETAIGRMAADLYGRVDWNWMAQGTDVLSMGWNPGKGFIPSKWIGYNEAMILLCLGLGAERQPLPSSAWQQWTSGYEWETNHGQAYVQFAPLFGHEYSHCWIDFRSIADRYMERHKLSYFENSRRASLAQRTYAIANPAHHLDYQGELWGLTASDGPGGYTAHGLPPAGLDDGTIAPTAVGGAIAFVPEYALPTLRHFYTRYRRQLWTAFGFRDAFNPSANWFGPDELGIDQGPIVLMIENYRTGKPWRLFMQDAAIQRGLKRAGFVVLPTAPAR